MDRYRLCRALRAAAVLLEEHHLPRAAAALSYFLTLTVFPLLICLYHMLGAQFPAGEQIRALLSGVLPPETVKTLLEFLRYVSENASPAMLVMALAVVLTSASAAFRVVSDVVAELRGGAGRGGALDVALSVVFSLVFLTAFYLAAVLILTGRWFLDMLDRRIMFANISDAWSWGRFVLLYLLLLALFLGVYRLTLPHGLLRSGRARLLPGALSGASALLLLSLLFAYFIGKSVKYPLVYGSLASVILMMLWLYLCGLVLLLGAAVNVALERRGRP